MGGPHRPGADAGVAICGTKSAASAARQDQQRAAFRKECHALELKHSREPRGDSDSDEYSFFCYTTIIARPPLPPLERVGMSSQANHQPPHALPNSHACRRSLTSK